MRNTQSKTCRILLGVGVALAIAAAAPSLGQAETLPTALLLYTFDSTSSSSGSTVVNNAGALGTTGSATLNSGCSVVSDSTSPFLGNALSVGGSGVMSTAANIISTSDLNSLTISYWAKYTGSLASWKNLVGYFSYTNNSGYYCNGWNMETNTTSGDAYFRVWNSANTNATIAQGTSSTGCISSSWQQITVTATGLTDTTANHAVRINFYLNGSLSQTYTATTSSTMSTANLQFIIGKLSWDSALAAEYGYVALYDSVLDAAQVQTLYNTSIGEAVPEPATTVLTIIGAGGLLVFAWRKRQK